MGKSIAVAGVLCAILLYWAKPKEVNKGIKG